VDIFFWDILNLLGEYPQHISFRELGIPLCIPGLCERGIHMTEKQSKILIVDDSEMVRNYHSYIIKMFGYLVETAENGAVALEKLLTGEYQLVITDINMPMMDGYEFIRKTHELGIHIPIIIVSTEEEQKLSNRKSLGGFGVHMVKPTDPEKLVSTVKMLL
jgi:two-component system chemotaxis response regulator CheY